MRKIFTNRARVVVYAEAEDVARMELHARSKGHTLPEWARSTLLNELYWAGTNVERGTSGEERRDDKPQS
jgi:hypothetical protein